MLGGLWVYRDDPKDSGLVEGFQRRSSLKGWRPIRVPYAWNATDLTEASQAGSIGWYRKDFRLPSARQALRWVIRFESVNYRARVWLNGRPIGSHVGAYLPFELIAQKVKRTGVNRLVVRVDSRRLPTDLPPGELTRFGAPGGGWWNDGGLLREVYLRSVEVADLRDVSVRTILPCASCAARIRFSATVRNITPRPRRVVLAGRFGRRLVRFEASRVPAFGFHRFESELRIDRPRLWSPARPYLYRVRLQLFEGKGEQRRLRQTYRLLSGVRSIRVTPNGLMLLNGRRVALRGASMHEDHPKLGAALGSRERAINISLLRRVGAMVTRAHYPLHPQTLELADRHGILVWSQIPVYQLSAEAFNRAEVRARAVRMLTEAIERDRNHASVFVWSIGNELPSRPGGGQHLYLQKGISTAKRLDPDRLVALDIAGYPSIEQQPIYRKLDAIGINDYFGWYPGPSGQILAREELGPYLDQVHRQYPGGALFVTEFGAEANRSGPIDEKGTYEFQRDFVRFHLQAIASRPFVNGAMVWLLKDFRVRPDWDGGNPKPTPPYNQKGIMDRFGKPKPAYGEVVRLFKSTEQLR